MHDDPSGHALAVFSTEQNRPRNANALTCRYDLLSVEYLRCSHGAQRGLSMYIVRTVNPAAASCQRLFTFLRRPAQALSRMLGVKFERHTVELSRQQALTHQLSSCLWASSRGCQ